MNPPCLPAPVRSWEGRLRRIHITGASGAGVTTLGAALACRLGVTHLDTDHFYWLPSDPPFRYRRPAASRIAMLQDSFAASPSGWVLSGSLDGWGDLFVPLFDAVVFVYTPPLERMARLLAREQSRYGAAIQPGGPMYEQHLEFVAWAEGYDRGDRAGRSLLRHEAWLVNLPCPVIRLDGRLPAETLADTVLAASSVWTTR